MAEIPKLGTRFGKPKSVFQNSVRAYFEFSTLPPHKWIGAIWKLIR